MGRLHRAPRSAKPLSEAIGRRRREMMMAPGCVELWRTIINLPFVAGNRPARISSQPARPRGARRQDRSGRVAPPATLQVEHANAPGCRATVADGDNDAA